jgi:hypothetical protein
MRKITAVLAFAGAWLQVSLHAEKLANGLEFRAPEGWSVKSNNEAAVLLPPDMAKEAGSNDPSELYIVAMLPGVKNLQDPQLASILKGQFFPAEAQLRPIGDPQTFRAASGAGYLHRYDAVSQGVALRIQIYVVGLNGGGAAATVAIGRPALVARRETLLATVAATLTREVAAGVSAPAAAPPAAAPNIPTTPQAGQWDRRLRGKKLYQFSSYSSSPGSGGMSNQKTLLLAADGTYQFRRAGSVAIYVDGANGSSASQGADQGRWRIYEQAGKITLELVSAKSGTENIVLTSDGTKTLLNGQRWLVGDN